MKKPAPNKLYTQNLGARIRLAPLAWFFWAITMVWLLAGAMIVMLTSAEFSRFESYAGTISVNFPAMEVSLPAGMFLDQILVEEGNLVQAEQTVATLDVSRMEIERERIVSRMAQLSSEIDCLLNAARSGGIDSQPPEVNSDMSVQTTLCLIEGDVERAELAAIDAQIAGIASQLEAVNAHILAVLAVTETGQTDQLRVGSLLNVLRSRLQVKQQELNSKRAEKSRINALDLQEKALTRTAEMRDLEEKIFEYDRWIANPTLKLRKGGRVAKVRPTKNTSALLDPVTILEIQDTSSWTYSAEFSAPLHAVDQLRSGDKVTLQLTSAANNLPQMSGHVAEFVSGATGIVTFSVVLDSRSKEILSQGVSGLSASNTTTAAHAEFKLEKHSFLSTLRDILYRSMASHWAVAALPT